MKDEDEDENEEEEEKEPEGFCDWLPAAEAEKEPPEVCCCCCCCCCWPEPRKPLTMVLRMPSCEKSWTDPVTKYIFLEQQKKISTSRSDDEL